MLRLNTFGALAALLWAFPASAASITWSEPVRMTTAEQTLVLPGHTLHAAAQFGSLPGKVSVDFRRDDACGWVSSLLFHA